jgi:hypothetical protein
MMSINMVATPRHVPASTAALHSQLGTGCCNEASADTRGCVTAYTCSRKQSLRGSMRQLDVAQQSRPNRFLSSSQTIHERLMYSILADTRCFEVLATNARVRMLQSTALLAHAEACASSEALLDMQHEGI